MLASDRGCMRAVSEIAVENHVTAAALPGDDPCLPWAPVRRDPR
jgi:hypothetical protein